ncbi:hypothetical protein [Burkholderia pseudomultivorans]|nr:hypothetical protein [Burkholderia pseudomultivorans]
MTCTNNLKGQSAWQIGPAPMAAAGCTYTQVALVAGIRQKH